jgi:hypothetical protein
MSAYQREEAHNAGGISRSLSKYLKIWLGRPSPIYMPFSGGPGVNKFQMCVQYLEVRPYVPD